MGIDASRRRLSIIIPAINESRVLQGNLPRLQALREAGHEVILVDGGSTDDTLVLAKSLVDRLVQVSQGRASQMNAGASVASGGVLLFLHADTLLPDAADDIIAHSMKQAQRAWGRFDVVLSGGDRLLRAVEFVMNVRSRLTGIATGDQAMFVNRQLFEAVGGFPEIPLMEDIALSRRLRRISPPLCLRRQVTTSSRRWERHGIVRTILLMWCLRSAYALGVDPGRLARIYDGV